MTRKLKLTFILTSVVLLIVAISTAGVSFALWTNQGGIGEGNMSVSPTVFAKDEYVWAKYFNIEIYEENGYEYATIGTFYDANAGLNLEDVIIPSKISLKGKDYQTRRISNQIFMDATLKKLPVVIYIPNTIMQIDAGAFQNLPNLKKVVFVDDGSHPACVIGDFAFAGCKNLEIVESGRGLVYGNSTFIGCSSKLIKPASQPTNP